MANILLEGFDNYPTGSNGLGQTGNAWISSVLGSINGPSIVTGVNGKACLWPNTNSTQNMYRPFASSSEVYFGFSLVINSLGAYTGQTLIGMRASSWLGFQVNSSGQPLMLRGATVLSTGTTPLLTGVKYYIEIHYTATTYELRIDGVVILSGTMSSTTNYSGFGCIRAFNGSGGEWIFDDLYVNDTTGTINNGYLGEITVVTIFPTADLTPQDWTPSTGSTAFGILDNNPNTADYVEGAAAGDIMRVDFSALGVPVTDIHMVVASTRMAKTTSGANTTVVRLENQGSQATGASHAPAETTYAYYYDTFETDPDTGLAWDPTTFAPKVEIERTV